ncbi:hypothetical protein D0469_20390 [Peribacillus saganii]|uniref:YtkA-like domain-containing protein n=1 Tax=Peribacillus saganii TaxID=2303992 RepID=A0A372LC99_9BACI|nr:FixH family protein [Peribacillus saganii]RFU62605.1 hypothetical protein D0469_20390 [Peribacillus saganii]
MRKRLSFILLTILPVMIAGCVNKQNTNTEQPPEIVEVDIQLPEKIEPNEETNLKVKVTQGAEAVKDADEVKFEIWDANKEEKSVFLEATHEKEGIYTVKNIFKTDGIYFVQSHVTARGLHTMPKKSFIVGYVTDELIREFEKNSQLVHESKEDGTHH